MSQKHVTGVLEVHLVSTEFSNVVSILNLHLLKRTPHSSKTLLQAAKSGLSNTKLSKVVS